MIVYEPKDKMRVIFTKNKDADFGNVIKELGYAKKNGDPYKYVEVQKGSYLKFDGAPETLSATKLKAKGVETYIVDDEVSVKVTKNGAGKFASVLGSFGSNVDIDIDGRKFTGRFMAEKDNVIKDANGTLVMLCSDTNGGVDMNEVTKFIYKMRQDNGNLLAPILRKYITTLHFVGKNRNIITGYAHLPTYLQMIKSPFSNFVKSFRNKDSESGIVFGAGKNDFMAKVKVRGSKGRKLLLEVQSGEKLSKLGVSESEKPNPYVLFSTAPLRFTSEETPKFAISMGRQTIFVTILLFNAEKNLQNIKGGQNLLKMW